MRGSGLRRWLAAVTTLCAVASPAGAAPFQVPPIVDPPSQTRHAGKVIFEQLVTTDLAGAKRFYTGLFGWTFQDVPGIKFPYAMAYVGARPVAGIVQREVPASEHRQPAWLSFFSVPDVDAAVRVAVDHGAKVLVAAHNVANRGRQALLTDPQGAVFAVLASTSGDPPDAIPPSGNWIWRALLTTDPAADADFYHAMFGFEAFPMSSVAGGSQLLFASENYARASANPLPGNRANRHPHWLNFVRVESAAQSGAKAGARGGRVLVTPRMDRHGGMTAVVADPAGAPVGLFEWSNTDTKTVIQ